MLIYITAILVILVIILLVKIIIIKKSIKDIQEEIHTILDTDTNNLITISSNDKEIQKLTSNLNIELRKLRKQRLEYENGNQELKKSITNISHDMRTPLTVISGYLDLLKENDNREKEYIEIIDRKTKELINLTEQLFDFSKTVDIGTNINKEKCTINEILEQSLANYYNIFKAEGIEPRVDICEEKVYRELDKNSITRVFENIFSNVIKYSNGDFKINLTNEGKITFSNKAISLDATTVQKIFDRYFTVENAKKATGIGLSIAKQLVELNGGKISAKYEESLLIIEIEL